MKLYYERWKFRHPSLADLREALAEGTGRPDIVEANFNSFVYATGRFDDHRITNLARYRLCFGDILNCAIGARHQR